MGDRRPRVGVDTGGTFTDVVGEDGRIAKVPSTPADPSRAVVAGMTALAPDGDAVGVLAHGTTVATNALLERRGAVVALVTNRGFADLIEIARQDRPSLYDESVHRPAPLVPRRLRFETAGRLGPSGEELEPVDVSDIPSFPPEVEAVAVCFLHADLDPGHERAVADAIAAARPDLDVCCSHEISPEFREYERLSTTVANAYVRPVCARYLAALEGAAGRVLVMASAGGLVPVAAAVDRPAALFLSGPAGGVLAASAAAMAAGFPDAVTFDMGGTSTDVCLVLDGRPAPAAERSVGGLPIRLPALDIHTIGAGGGSIARIDPGGALAVGPSSAGADPGPACYGKGGEAATVTDADLVAGRIPADAPFPGLGALSVDAARVALDAAGIDADGVIAVVDEAMVQAVRRVTVERGVDPRGLALVAFGGAGPLHACAVAAELGMAAVVVPPRAGVLSAAGMLAAPERADRVRTWPGLADHEGLDEARAALAEEVARLVTGVGAVEVGTALDCRYAGQAHEITVDDVGRFDAEHRRRNGFDRPGTPVEVVAVRAWATLASPVALGDLPAPAGGRAPATGPAVLAEPDCTVWIPPGWSATVHASGAWIIRR